MEVGVREDLGEFKGLDCVTVWLHQVIASLRC